jgi:biotin carboxyl carrier protein
MTWEVVIDGETVRVELSRDVAPGQWSAHIGDREVRFSAAAAGRDALSLLVEGASYEVRRESVASAEANGAESNIYVRGRRYRIELRDPRALRSRRARAAAGAGPKKLLSPMPGKVIRVLAAEGASVAAGAPVLVIEAMKMQNEIKSPKAGVVQKVLAPEGTAVNAGDVLAIVE